MCMFVFKKWCEASIVMPSLFLSLLVLHCREGFSPAAASKGCCLVGASRLLTVVVSLAAERGL